MNPFGFMAQNLAFEFQDVEQAGWGDYKKSELTTGMFTHQRAG